ncbi:minor capsid protein E [Deltaproteobacteria bacterium]|nr:minor capsid protein E [Deltaproteobacteria bacterium]
MPVIVNPFESGGYTLAHMSRAMQIIPNTYGRINQLGLFVTEPISQRNVTIESMEGELRLLPTRPVGSPATVGTPDVRKMRSFTVPHVPHNDVVLPEEVQGIRGFGLENGEDPLATVMARKLTKMRTRHAQTLEYMRVKALSGITKDGEGNTIYNWHQEFGIQKKSQDFSLDTATKDVLESCREIARHIEDNLMGESMSGILALVSPGFFDKLIRHTSVKEAYKYQQATNGANPLRDDIRRGFRFGNMVFEEYSGTVTLANGQTDHLIIPDEGIAFPLGTTDTFRTYFAPGNFLECVGTYGQELYARQIARPDGTGIDILTQSNPLPIVKRPALIVRIFSEN